MVDTAAEQEKTQGNKFFKGKDYAQAIKHYSKAIELDPKNSIYYVNRAIAYLKIEQYEKADADCTQGLKIDPKNIKAFWRRAVAKEQLGKLEEAKNDLDSAVSLEPNNGSIRQDLLRISEKIASICFLFQQNYIYSDIESIESFPDNIAKLLNINQKQNEENKAKKEEKFPTSVPQSIPEFDEMWNQAGDNPVNVLNLIKVIPTDNMEKIFGSIIEEKHLDLISQALELYISGKPDQTGYEWVQKLLFGLSQLPRFNLGTVFLNVEAKKSTSADDIDLEQMNQLKKLYNIESWKIN
ncbi:hypothetical protein BB560_002754, partial [Smittium megazygosporum]